MSHTTNMDDPDAVLDAISQLIIFHTLGRRSLDEYPGRMPYGVASKLGKRHGLHPETLRHARRFASPALDGYTRKELDRLFGRAERHQYVLTRSNVTKLLTIRDRAVRSELELLMIEGRWSRRQLDDEIRKLLGKRMNAGRRPRRAADGRDAALQILRAAEQTQRVFEQFGVGCDDSADPEIQLPPKLRCEMAALHKALGRLAVIAGEAMES